jgi:hypothetical protein
MAGLYQHRKIEFQTDLDFIRIANAIGLGNGALFTCVGIESLGDMRKVIARLDLVRLLICSGVGNFVMKIGVRWVRLLRACNKTLPRFGGGATVLTTRRFTANLS